MKRLIIAGALAFAAVALSAQPAGDIFTRIRTSNDVAWLARIAAEPGARVKRVVCRVLRDDLDQLVAAAR